MERLEAVGASDGWSAALTPSVLMFHTTLPAAGRKPGGVEVAVHRLANALVGVGVPITVASLGDAPGDARYAHRKLFGGSAWLRDSRIGRLFVLPVLLNWLKRGEADVVHYHGDDWFTVRRPFASVRTLHGSALREAQRATRLPRRLLQYLLFPLEGLSARLATIGVGVGSDVAALHGLTRVIGNGFDPAVFHPGSKSDTPTLLYVGTWEGRKRGQWMYERFVNDIAPRHAGVTLHFVADEAPPPHPRVVFTRFPDDAALAALYRAAWVFVLPSMYEGFGIPYLEAMASGTAVVATPNTGALDLLGNNEFGLLAVDGDFARVTLELLTDAAKRCRLEEASIERAADMTWDAVARAYAGVYADALAMRAGS